MRVLNLVPLYMKVPQVSQRTDIGSIIRTFICLSSLRTLEPRGTFEGSKSGGKYLLRTGGSGWVGGVGESV